jgi:hypothetical protein
MRLVPTRNYHAVARSEPGGVSAHARLVLLQKEGHVRTSDVQEWRTSAKTGSTEADLAIHPLSPFSENPLFGRLANGPGLRIS